jgi:Zn-dependent metalloprotease
LTHGITEYTANLIYQDQPGALNESFSDFFGAMVDRDDWIMGEDIMLPGMGSGLRDLSNPHNRNMLDQLPMTMDEYVYTSSDYGGVHTNCGIPCYAAYLIADRIGKDKTEKIYYRALSSYLTRQSQFIDARKRSNNARSICTAADQNSRPSNLLSMPSRSPAAAVVEAARRPAVPVIMKSCRPPAAPSGSLLSAMTCGLGSMI